MSGAAFLDVPYAFDARGRSAVTGDDDHLRDMIMQVLFTIPGERVNRPEFGCGIGQLVFAPAQDALAAAAEQLIHGALLRWLEPLISVETVTVAIVDAAFEITVVYARRDTGERQQDVFRQQVAAS
ncbi:GPW/gp25 family protein [Sphingomonas quercus]|uniref:GPW/gp25 family protein n=1 Tax=Sphingomonas quercus TaxID=2842451 RepID=A0ABS6BL06_9SPHN|nr:GPW/gp25 family protein [Sphingomonas quercus]MBU3078992.1 GPW/gp25 family protein [Sphingomonas quercus]